MITALRHLFVDSWLGRLMALLTFFAFVVWGGDSIFNLSSKPSGDILVSIGKEEVKTLDFERLLDMRLRVLAERFSSAKWVYSQEGVSQVAQVTLSSMVGSLAAMQEAKSAGFIVSDERVREQVFSDTAFQGEDKKFDPAKMNMLLQASGQTREGLINQVRQELYGKAVLEGLGNSLESSHNVSTYLSNYFGNTYKVDAVRIPFKKASDVTEQPSEAQLKRFYLNHAALFRLPEYRHITVAVLTQESVSRSIKVSDDSLKHLYEERQHLYNAPETRDVNVLMFSDENQAKDCKALWQKEISWADFSGKCSQAVPASLEKARKSDVPSDVLAEAIFAAGTGVLTGPVVASEGQWAIVFVDKVYPPVNRSFEEVRPELLKEVQSAGISDAFHQKLGAFEEAVAGTGDLKKLPSDLGIEIFSATVNAEGKTPADREVVLPGNAALQTKILKEAFSKTQGELPQAVVDGDQAYAISVDETSPARLQSFQEIKEEILQKWREEVASHQTEVEVAKLLQKAQVDPLKKSLEESAIKGGEYHGDVSVSRMKQESKLPAVLSNRILLGESNKAVMVQDGESFWVSKITQVIPMEAQERDKMSLELREKATASLHNDIIENLGRLYVGKYKTKNFNVKAYQEIITRFVR
ncbi:hypothetical protein FAI40_00980 [Acetobacteraceae bacterium]|nr:hypothetical protein FAI40_00980 [Acetobacteraceae bacterium]